MMVENFNITRNKYSTGWYYRLSEIFPRRFPFKVRKIPVHAGTTCPNRDSTKEYLEEPFPLFTVEEYQQLLVELLEILSPEVCIHRLISEATDQEILIGPHWDLSKASFHQEVERKLKMRRSHQGSAFLE